MRPAGSQHAVTPEAQAQEIGSGPTQDGMQLICLRCLHCAWYKEISPLSGRCLMRLPGAALEAVPGGSICSGSSLSPTSWQEAGIAGGGLVQHAQASAGCQQN